MKIATLARKVNKSERHFYGMREKKHGCSVKLAEKLQEVTGISKLKWLLPDEYGSPFDDLKKISE